MILWLTMKYSKPRCEVKKSMLGRKKASSLQRKF